MGNEAHNHAEALTTLTTLQKLEIRGPLSLLPVVGKLTMLTHLCLRTPGPELDLSPFTRLRNLVHLQVDSEQTRMVAQHFQSLGAIITLRSLRLNLTATPRVAGLEAYGLSAMSRLTSLALRFNAPDMPFVAGFNLEGLESLTLTSSRDLYADGVTILGRATSLTELGLRYGEWAPSHVPVEVGLALSRMSRLQALSFEDASSSSATSCFKAIGLLTGLTSLMWDGSYIANTELKACLGLKKLRFLRIPRQPWIW